MLQLTMLRPTNGAVTSIGTYPFRIGRGPGDQLRIQAPGVWEGHCTLEWRGADGIHLVGSPEAITAVNGQTVKEIKVRNGDLLDIGGARLMLSVRPAPQRTFRLLEILVWLVLAGIGLTQLFLMFYGLP
jgi:pSer/pThr/pTyr-binding forkhead associated (FHA) protein